MRRLLALLLLSAAGCSGFDSPTPALLQGVPLEPEFLASAQDFARMYTRCRFQMSVDSPSLAGEFDGVVVALHTLQDMVVRAQLFGDLGPKVADLTARPGRIAGYFPQTREGIDSALPQEASPHLLLFLGASLVEEFLTRADRSRVTGIREENGEKWLRLQPAIPETMCSLFLGPGRETKKRRFSWMTGVSWEEEWSSPRECRIRAPNLSIRVKILERSSPREIGSSTFDLTLPQDVRIVAGSRK